MPSYPIPDGPHNDAWKSLLPACFEVVDEVERTRGVAFPIRIGGGSMLLRRYGHRKSLDLDLFVNDVQLVRWCSPTANDAAMNLFPDYYEEPNAVNLITEMQEIDIIAAAPIISENAVDEATVEGRRVLVERPREIVAKKIAYRGRMFLVRDMFDLACVATCEPKEVAALLPTLTLTNVEDLHARLRELEPVWDQDMTAKVDAYQDFKSVVRECKNIVRALVDAWRKELTPGVAVPKYPTISRAVFSADGRTVVIKERDVATRRHTVIGNTLGPAKVGPNMAMDMLLRRMNVDVTVHGFRSSFRDWCGEVSSFPREVAEAALAHVVGDATERAYRRGDALEKRGSLMEQWSDYCTGGAAALASAAAA